jgi:hypothetical protein
MLNFKKLEVYDQIIDLMLAADTSQDAIQFREELLNKSCQRKGIPRELLDVDVEKNRLIQVFDFST